MKKLLIGFIGQGWIGRNYSDDLEKRGYTVVRYSLEAPYNANKDNLTHCDIVFIAVPTPTRPVPTAFRDEIECEFDDSALRTVLPLVPIGKIGVIKSTVTVGHTQELQRNFPDRIILHSPEFLSERTAAEDAANPDRNIVGIPIENELYISAAKEVLSVLPPAPYNNILKSDEAELIKYAHNIHGYIQVVFANLMVNLTRGRNMSWKAVTDAMKADPLMPKRYLNPYDKKGRGAGGHCFIKDFETFINTYRGNAGDPAGLAMLIAIRNMNLELLVNSGKDLDIVKSVYGKGIIDILDARGSHRKKKETVLA